jgi:drug/metabolite transporter (DMT)-like permease
MDISVVLAQIGGIFFVVIGVAMAVSSKAIASALEESVEHKGMMLMWGILALLIGAVVIVLNNIWTTGLPLLVTILGWLALLKGTFILLAPAAATSLYKKFGKSGMVVFVGVVVFVIGLVLLYW